MNPQRPQNSVQDIFGRALGLVAGVMLTMPLYHWSYAYFFDYALQFAPYDQRDFWEIVWIAVLFFVIFSVVWSVVVMIITAFQKAILFLIISFKIRRERSRW